MPPDEYSLPGADLEQAFERLAEALDAVGPEHEKEFLCRLALALAARLGGLHALDAAIAEASRDL